MEQTYSVITAPSARQAEFLAYVPAVMNYETEMNRPDIPSLEKAVAFFVSRHESVRTVFPVIDGQPKQAVLSCDTDLFRMEILEAGASEESYLDVRSACMHKAELLFADKQKGPLIKFFLLKAAGGRCGFLLLIDHIICDGWSLEKIIKEEISMLYQRYAAGSEPEVQPIKVQLRHYSEQQEAWLNRKKHVLSEFWKQKLAGYGDRYDINSFYDGYYRRTGAVAATGGNYKVKTLKAFMKLYKHQQSQLFTFKISGHRFERIRQMADEYKCTTSAVIYASLYLFLYSYTGRNRILIAAFIADRFSPSYRFIIGLLLGTVYFPREINDNVTVQDFIRQTMYDILTNCQNMIFNHEFLSLDEERLNMGFDILINYIRANGPTPSAAAQWQNHVSILGSPYVLEAMIYEYDDSFVFYWKYKPLFEEAIIEDMISFYSEVLDFMLSGGNSLVGDLKNALIARRA